MFLRLLAILAIALVAGATPASRAQEAPRPAWAEAPSTERLELSGPDAADPRPWRFRISSGARAGEDSTIPVPSQWELHGFGDYSYGQQKDAPAEEGRYALDFEIPAEWAGRRLELVFEGSMTDTEATLNGESVGPVHQGGFTRFSYDVTKRVRVGEVNRLDVVVRERSANRSVEAAERNADYWLFGGIYRPVHLDAHPASSIDHVAIDARADGRLRALVETVGAEPGARIAGRVLDADERELARLEAPIGADGRAILDGRVADAPTWSHEHPVLHRLELTLHAGARALHRVEHRFGFRTVELRFEDRKGDGETPGIYVNGVRTLLRGINRHSFWPESGRALSAARNRADAELIRSLHFNAVRASHYPPDVAFLEACDELGIYVIDELPGWHDAYDDDVGERLVAELVRRDVNHPSVLLWANGNEGGWNTALDRHFAEHDPQSRPVIHPWDDFGGLDTGHYPSWEELAARLDDAPRGLLPWRRRAPVSLVLPTEALHALFDGGGGASLGRYWSAISRARRGAGLFLWALLDEGVVRVDRGGELDHFGNYAPDGVVDAWRRLEPSALAAREILAPVRVVETALRVERTETSLSGGQETVTIHLENRFAERSLDGARVAWRALRFPGPFEPASELATLVAGEAAAPAVAPGRTAALELPWNAGADALEVAVSLDAEDPLPPLELAHAVLPGASRAAAWSLAAPIEADTQSAPITDTGHSTEHGPLVLERGGTRVLVDPASGELVALEREGRRLALRGGARAAGGPRPRVRATRFERGDGRDSLEIAYREGFRRAVWSVDDDGAVALSWMADDDGDAPFAGIVFDYPRERVESLTWLGGGPFAVWSNRLEGATLGLWRAPRAATDELVAVPLEGARSGVRWARVATADGELVIVPQRDPRRPAAAGPFLSVYPPAVPDGAQGARADLPEGIAILHRIPPIGSKFHRGDELVAAEPRAPGLLHGRVILSWRPAAASSLASSTASAGGR